MVKLRFYSTYSLTSNVVCWYTKSNYSHVELVLPEGYLGSWISCGVAIRKPLEDPKFKTQTTVALDIESSKIVSFAKSQIGRPYDCLAVMGITLNTKWEIKSSWTCSELIAASFHHAGIPLIDKHCNLITPEEVYKAVINYGPLT